MTLYYDNLKNALISDALPADLSIILEKPSNSVMTPELKIACEIVFQEHKVSIHPIKWNRIYFADEYRLACRKWPKRHW